MTRIENFWGKVTLDIIMSRAGLTIVPLVRWHEVPRRRGPPRPVLIFLLYKSNVRQKELITVSSEIK